MAYKLITLAGSVAGSFGNVDAPAGLDARFNSCHDCALAPDRSKLYVADWGNNTIRVVTLAGTFPVSTLATVYRPNAINVHPTTGDLWVSGQDTLRQTIHQVTAAGVVTLKYNFIGNDNQQYSPLPDADNVYARVKHWGGGQFYSNWKIHVLADWTDTGIVSGNEGNLAGFSGHFWSTKYPGVVIYNRDYSPPSSKGFSIRRDDLYGSAFQSDWDWGQAANKLVPGPDVGPNESAMFVNGAGKLATVQFRSDPAAPYLDPNVAEFVLPTLPAKALARDPVTGTIYIPTNPGWGTADGAGATDTGTPYNAIVLAVPADDLSLSYQ